MHRPLEPRHVAQVGQIAARGKGAQELGEGRPVLEEAGPRGWLDPDVLIGRVAEEALVDQPAHHREHGLQRPRQGGEDVVPVDLKPSLRGQAVPRHEGGRPGVV